ncbi:hypothetical protein GOBAR_DD05312 [Gossypium barbadense]|nr:hypothetical protein GOBAR_DD05312 [Gossypium barbadense]
MSFSTKKSVREIWRKTLDNHSPFSYVFGLNFIPNMSVVFHGLIWLFVIPLQSNVTRSRYSYTWMSLVQENGWHVLLDAIALGAKEMETLRLSLFDPDFHICSFFGVFCENPSRFYCLFIKKSIGLSVLKGSTTNVGIVSLVPPLKLEAPKGKAPLHEIKEIIDSITSNTLQCKALDHANSLGA